MDKRATYDTIARIVSRANSMGITIGSRMTQHMDMMNADKQFDMRWDDMLAADNENFAHDFCGIQHNINRITCKVENLFFPRFARPRKEQ